MTDWETDCLKWRNKILTGKFKHYCFDWDELPVDETCPEWPCSCFSTINSQTKGEKIRKQI